MCIGLGGRGSSFCQRSKCTSSCSSSSLSRSSGGLYGRILPSRIARTNFIICLASFLEGTKRRLGSGAALRAVHLSVWMSPEGDDVDVLTHLLLDGCEIFHSIGVWVLKVLRKEAHLDPTNEVQLFITVVLVRMAPAIILALGTTYVRLSGLPVFTSVKPVHPFGTSMLSRRLCSASPVAGRMIFLPLIS